MRIITSGRSYLDIDAYAGIVAYAELLRAQGEPAIAASTAPFNDSIPKELRNWKIQFNSSYSPKETDTFTLLDISEPRYFDKIVSLDRVDEIIDHHPGLKDYWAKQPYVKTDIEFIGAVCTQVYERWLKADLPSGISKPSAGLLACGILDNTLNFGAQVTTSRDRQAYGHLSEIAGLGATWPKQYFSDCERSILADPNNAIRNDSKIIEFKSIDSPLAVGQLVVWEAEPVSKQFDIIKQQLQHLKSNWFMNLISLSDRRSHFITDDMKSQKWLNKTLGVEFSGERATADRPWLRKEIIKRDLEIADNTKI